MANAKVSSSDIPNATTTEVTQENITVTTAPAVAAPVKAAEGKEYDFGTGFKRIDY